MTPGDHRPGYAAPSAPSPSEADPGSDDDPQPRGWSLARMFKRAFTTEPAPRAAFSEDESLEALARRAARDVRAPLVNLLRMREQRVEDVMTPRADIVAAPETASLDELVEIFREASLTRVPVFRDTLDDPIGFVHLKDIAFAYGFGGAEAREGFTLRAHIRQPLYVPPSMTTAALLDRMQASRKHMALVIDEYGGVDGLVTIEDLVEQIVGDIEDEHDDADPAAWREESPGVWLCAARADIDAFSEIVGVHLAPAEMAEEVDTLGGLVFMLSNRIPERGEVILHPDGHEFEVIDADPRRIKRLRVTLAGRGAPAAQ